MGMVRSTGSILSAKRNSSRRAYSSSFNLTKLSVSAYPVENPAAGKSKIEHSTCRGRRLLYHPMSYRSDLLAVNSTAPRVTTMSPLAFRYIYPDFGFNLAKNPRRYLAFRRLGRFRLGLKGTLDLLIGVRIPASQSTYKTRLSRVSKFHSFVSLLPQHLVFST